MKNRGADSQDPYSLKDSFNRAVTSDPKKPPTYDEILEVQKALEDAEVPMDNRVMYYYKISWWRHPFKRYKQKQALERVLSTDD